MEKSLSYDLPVEDYGFVIAVGAAHQLKTRYKLDLVEIARQKGIWVILVKDIVEFALPAIYSGVFVRRA